MHFQTLILSFVLAVAGGCGESMTQTQTTHKQQLGPPSVVTLEQTSTGYQLIRNGEPYVILGVGGTSDLQRLKDAGGNTIRTWDAEGIEPLMDEAHELGLAVMVGIWLEHQRHGYDHQNPEHRQHDLDRVEMFVKQFRDHPALLGWGVGNELELGGDLDIALQQINAASALIKELDPNHPTMSVIAEIGDDKAVRIQNECPNIDMIGINSYGGLGTLGLRVQNQGYTGPYAVTEFGPVGFWETGVSSWGAPYEQTSGAKADFIRRNYEATIESNLSGQCVGSFAFLWGNKQEKTETWFGLILPTGERTEMIDVLTEFWSGKAPENRAPRVTGLTIDTDVAKIDPGQTILVEVNATDADGDELETEWRVMPESVVRSEGGDAEPEIATVPIGIETINATSAKLTLPKEIGAYRVYATVRDGQGNAGTANLPILIVSPEDD